MATYRQAEALSPDESPHWVEAHEALSRLARGRAALDAEEGRWLLRALRSDAHVHLGFGSFCQYVERLFGYKPRTTQEKLRVAEALESLPELAGALASGALGWCAARELTRVAVPETERAWLEAARGRTQRELEALVADKSSGDDPDSPGDGIPRRHVLRFEVAADTFATFREAMQHLERAAGSRLDHDALLLALARHALGGPTGSGRSSYQVSLHVCSVCRRGEQVAAGELVPVESAVVEMAACDAQHLGTVLAPAVAKRAANENAKAPGPASQPSPEPDEWSIDHVDENAAASGRASQPSAEPDACSFDDVNEDAAASGRASQPSAEPDERRLDHVDEDAAASGHASQPSAEPDERRLDDVNEDAAVTECSNHAHVGATVNQAATDPIDTLAAVASPSPPDAPRACEPLPRACESLPRARESLPRARQSIPPALRRAVLQRDRHRCQVPGCTHTTYVDVHHIRRRADGGLNVIDNLLTLCSVHHRATHHGQLLIEPGPDSAWVFRHGDGRLYGEPPSPQRVDVHTKVFSALRHLGFRESEVKAVLTELRADPALADAPAERMLREALCRIKPRAR